MVVILLLTPPYTQHDGCDGAGSNDSSTSTGETAISANTYKVHSQQQQPQPQQQQQQQQKHYLPSKNVWKHFTKPQQQQPQPKQYHYPYSSHSSSNNINNNNRYSAYPQSFPAKQWNCRCRFCNVAPAPTSVLPPVLPKNQPPHDTYNKWSRNNATNAVNGDVDGNHDGNNYYDGSGGGGLVNNVPHMQLDKSFYGKQDQWFNAAGNTNHVTFAALTHVTPKRQKHQHEHQQLHRPKKDYIGNRSQRPRQVDNIEFCTTTPAASNMPTFSHFNNFTNPRNCTTSDYVRHVTRVNFYDVDTSQVEFSSKDNNNNKEETEGDEPLDTEAITKEEEWITKRKTELTTTRQIETRVKRQVVLEDGKVVEDSGPIVSTNTTEDTDKQETETTEKRDLGIPQQDDEAMHQGIDALKDNVADHNNQLTVAETYDDDGGKLMKKMVARPADGLVRESNEKRVISHEEVKDYLETEDVKHLGDFSDEIYVQAVNSNADNLEEVLLSPANQQQLVPLGPRIVKQTSKARKTIDSENVQKRCLAQDDGTLITESKKTTEHEIIADEDIPEGDLPDAIVAGSQEKLYSREAKQRYFKQRDEQNVDLLVDGKVIDTEMRYAAETAQMEKEGSLERSGDWDSLSDRMRKMRTRTHQKSIMQQHKAALLADRKDALTKRPLDFDREEETRKGETMKWLESHFGSESTASNDSREDVEPEIEPTKKTYFNVTIKSGVNYVAPQPMMINGNKSAPITHNIEHKYGDHNKVVNNHNNTKYYQGISNWSDRNEAAPLQQVIAKPPIRAGPTPTANHFSSKAFRDDLQMTVERNRLRRNDGSREHLTTDFKDNNYVSREDILQQKRQSLTAQYLARSRPSSREQLDERLESSPTARKRDVHNLSNSRTDLRNKLEPRRPSYIRANTMDLNGGSGHRNSLVHSQATPRMQEYVDIRAKSYDRELNDTAQQHYEEHRTMKYSRRSPSPEPIKAIPQNSSSSSTLGRPSVPQRRRAIEKKLHQQLSKPLKVVQLAEAEQRGMVEPPPDYSPPPRSRSSSPPLGYVRGQTKNYSNNNDRMELDTLQRKQNQRTRFAPAAQRQSMSTQTTQTPPSNISTSTTATSQKSSRRVGQVIGNSLRKLVSKIRSVSAERKLRMKSKSKSREQSPAPPMLEQQNNDNMSTYQQYNRQIDSHIGGQGGSNESEREDSFQPEMSLKQERESAPPTFQGARRRESADSENIINPRQRYYLGEDPYSSTLYGKENIYDPESLAKRQRATRKQIHEIVSNGVHHEPKREEVDYNNQQRTHQSIHTLGRYQKSNNRFAGSTPNLSHPDYRSTQTLPRKLHDNHHNPKQHSHYQYQKRQATPSTNVGYTTLGHPDRRPSYQQAHANTGPAKPARTYAKALNRSRSFSVHGMNGSTDPSPVYMEKLNRQNYNSTNNNYHNNNNGNIHHNNNSNLHASQAYKSNPHLFSSAAVNKENTNTMLKSPSIVNLISRSQRDLSKIGGPHGGDDDVYDDSRDRLGEGRPENSLYYYNNKSSAHNKLMDDYADVRKPSQYQLRAKHSLPVELNKDTASIVRHENSDYNNMQKHPVLMYRDEHAALRRGSGATVIEVRHK